MSQNDKVSLPGSGGYGRRMVAAHADFVARKEGEAVFASDKWLEELYGQCLRWVGAADGFIAEGHYSTNGNIYQRDFFSHRALTYQLMKTLEEVADARGMSFAGVVASEEDTADTASAVDTPFERVQAIFDTLSDREKQNMLLELQKAQVRSGTHDRLLECSALSLFSEFTFAATWLPSDTGFTDPPLWDLIPAEYQKLRDAWLLVLDVQRAVHQREQQSQAKSQYDAAARRVRENVAHCGPVNLFLRKEEKDAKAAGLDYPPLFETSGKEEAGE